MQDIAINTPFNDNTSGVATTTYVDRVRMRWVVSIAEDVSGTGISPIVKEKTVKSRQYVDLFGRIVSKETKGILIEMIKYEDGTIENKKIFNNQ